MKNFFLVLMLLILPMQIAIADTLTVTEEYIDMIDNGQFTEEDFEEYMTIYSNEKVNPALGNFLEAKLMLDVFDYKGAYGLLEASLRDLSRDENLRLKAEVLYYLSEIDLFFFDITSSVERAIELREISKEIDYYKGVIEADYNIAFSYIYNYDYEQGNIFASEAFDLSRTYNYDNGLAAYYSFLGDLDYYYGEYDDAILKYELALDKVEKQSDAYIIETPKNSYKRVLAYEYIESGEYEKGYQYVEEIIEETDPENYYILYILEDILGKYYSYDDPEEALLHYSKAYDYYLLSSIVENSFPYEIYLLEAIGNMNYEIGNYLLAADFFYDVINFDYTNDDDAYGVMLAGLDDIKYEEINSKMSLLEQLNSANEESISLSKRMVLILTIGIVILMIAIVIVVIEMRAKTRTEKELYYTSITDSLTKVYNRGKIIDVFKSNLNKNNAILLMDVDNFKNINDQYGHLVGDEVLIILTELVKEAIRDCDKIGRYGGEEFLVVLEKTNTNEISEIAERIRKNIAEHEWGYAGMKVTVSIGVTTCFSTDAEEVLHEADTLMYKAKNSGKNRIVFGC